MNVRPHIRMDLADLVDRDLCLDHQRLLLRHNVQDLVAFSNDPTHRDTEPLDDAAVEMLLVSTCTKPWATTAPLRGDGGAHVCAPRQMGPNKAFCSASSCRSRSDKSTSPSRRRRVRQRSQPFQGAGEG